jgi:Raf kinase inhibitor-like YbhB/YbcL family protein
MKVESSAFSQGQPIPPKHTCDGPDVSPDLRWSDAPAETKSYALIADDPDAPMGTWVHWVLYNVPANSDALPEGLPKQAAAGGAVQGKNDFGHVGYGGPCPPPGKPHRYLFKLYALDTTLTLRNGATKKDVEAAMQGHILANAELVGTYQRRK